MRHECFVLEEIGKWSTIEQKIFWFFEFTNGMSRLYSAYQQNQKPTQHYSTEWPKARSSVLESVKKAEKENKTVVTWLKDSDELTEIASKILQTIRNRYFFRRHKKRIRGRVLRKHGISWIRLGNGIFTPVADSEFYSVDKITGVLFEHQHPHPFSLP